MTWLMWFQDSVNRTRLIDMKDDPIGCALVLLGFCMACVGDAIQDEENPRRLRETEWSAKLAEDIEGAQTEFRLPDGSRVDILTDETAWEVEWSDKWEEAIGQSSFYGIATNRKPGVWLLLRGDHDEDYLRCLLVCRKLGIQLKTVKTE